MCDDIPGAGIREGAILPATALGHALILLLRFWPLIIITLVILNTVTCSKE